MENMLWIFYYNKKFGSIIHFCYVLHARSAPASLVFFFLQHARPAPVQALAMLFPLSGRLSLGISAWLTALFPPNLPSVTDTLITLVKTYPYLYIYPIHKYAVKISFSHTISPHRTHCFPTYYIFHLLCLFFFYLFASLTNA